MKINNVELIEEESIISLFNEENEELKFYELAVVELNDNFYGVLQAAEIIEDLSEDEVVILKMNYGDDDDTVEFEAVEDEELLDRIFADYCDAVAQAEEECGCDCGCDDCDCEECDDSCDCGEDCDCDHHHKS